MRNQLVWTAVLALVLAPVLCSCSSSRRGKRVRRNPAFVKAPTGSGGPMLAEAAPAPNLPPPLPPSEGFAPSDTGMAPMADGGAYADPYASGYGAPVGASPAEGAPAEGAWTEAPAMPAMPPMPGEGMPGEVTPAPVANPQLDAIAQQNAELKASLDELREMRSRERNDIADVAPFPGPPEQGAPQGHMPVDQALASLETSLRSSARGTEVLRQGNQVVIRLTDAFAPGKDELLRRSETESALSAAAQALGQFPDARVAVIGHSDTTPIKHSRNRWSSNHHLSQARAQVVASRLTAAGVSQGRVQATGLGATQPLVTPERSKSDRARNRRVEIVISL